MLRDKYLYDYAVVDIDNNQLVLNASVDYDEGCGEPAGPEELATAQKIAEKEGFELLDSGRTDWWGYSEYTPDPGGVVIFEWKKK